MEKMKDLRDMTLNELDKYLRDNGVTANSNIVIDLESGSRVTLMTSPFSTPTQSFYSPYGYNSVTPPPTPPIKKD